MQKLVKSSYLKQWKQENKEKVKLYAKKYRQNNKTKRNLDSKKYHLKYWFGISLNEYNKLSIQQNHLCAICGEKDEGKKLAVDHDHKTGIIRGLLCKNCNMALGLMKDNAKSLIKAIEYLEKQQQKSCKNS